MLPRESTGSIHSGRLHRKADLVKIIVPFFEFSLKRDHLKIRYTNIYIYIFLLKFISQPGATILILFEQ